MLQSLFPESFGRLAIWHDSFHAHADALLRRATMAIRRALSVQTDLGEYIDECQVQMRVKDVASMFKKMLNSGKSLKKMHDLLGMRVIVFPRSVSAAGNNDAELLPTFDEMNGELGTRVFVAAQSMVRKIGSRLHRYALGRGSSVVFDAR
jgi:hypothetical protein